MKRSAPPDSGPADTPAPPYYAVIFTNQLAAEASGYAETAERMVALAAEQPGFLGVESVRDVSGLGITVSYWSSEAAIATWRRHAEHQLAQQLGRERWYEWFQLRVAKVERAHGKSPADPRPTTEG